MPRKTPQGEGYTVRRDGRKILKTKLLEAEIEELRVNYEGLLRQNETLRAKEATQLTLLGNYEAWLRRLSGLTTSAPLSASPESPDHKQSLTAQLEERVQHLKQHLVLPLAAATGANSVLTSSSQAAPGNRGTALLDPASSAAAAAAVAAAGNAKEGSSNNAERWFNMITPEDVAAWKGYTLEQLAVHMRGLIRRLAVAHWAVLFEGNTDAVQEDFDLLEDIARASIASTINDELLFAKLYGFNMDTLQFEAPTPAHWLEVVKAVNLTQEQKDEILRTYQYVSQQQATAMQRQASIVQELQPILGDKGPKPAPAPAAVPTADSPAQLLSFATGGPVLAAPSAPDSTVPNTSATAAAAAAAGMAAQGSACMPVPDAFAAVTTAWQAVAPVSDGELLFLADLCRELSPDVESSGAGHSSNTHSSLASSSWVAPAGVLTLQDADRVKQLLEELVRTDLSVKQYTQHINIVLPNVLSTTQRAEAMLASYPWFLATTEFCAAVVQLEAESKQKKQGRATSTRAAAR